MESKDHEHLPQAAHDGSAEPWDNIKDPADSVREPGADEVRQRANDQEGQRNEDEDHQHGSDETAYRRVQLGVEESLSVALQPHDDDDGDHARDIADHRDGDAEERNVRHAVERDDRRIYQRPRDCQGGELTRSEVLRGCYRQRKREEVDKRVRQSVEDCVCRRRCIDPAESH